MIAGVHERANVFSPPLRGLRGPHGIAQGRRHGSTRTRSGPWLALVGGVIEKLRSPPPRLRVASARCTGRLCSFSRVKMRCAHAPIAAAGPLARWWWVDTRLFTARTRLARRGRERGIYTARRRRGDRAGRTRLSIPLFPLSFLLLVSPRLSHSPAPRSPLPARLLSAHPTTACSAPTHNTRIGAAADVVARGRLQ